MKLKVTDWRHAWFESHISDRFFQEMAKLEKGPVQGLEHSAQWMEQIMIEVGMLAQAMIRLERDGAPEPQIKQAYEKCLRLAALCMHLITALDGADRASLRSPARGQPEPAAQRAPLPPPAYPQPGAPFQAPQLAADPRAAGAAAAPPGQAAAPEPAGPLPHPLARGPAALRPPLPPARSAATDEAEPDEPDAPAAPAAAEPAPLFSSLLQVTGREQPHVESEMHQTIRSLSEQGLSRAEIEVVTGEPRHVIEAVLNHARGQARAGAQST